MPAGSRSDNLKTAAKVIAEAAKVLSRSAKITAGMKVYKAPGGGSVFIAAGAHGGKWGWVPVNAWMFETPDSWHPLFAHGPRGTDGWRHWYVQPYRPFLEMAAETTGQEAAEVFASLEIARLARLNGFDKVAVAA